jgi:pimeloyl-ACP methyl ester carboxylesterase
MSAVIIDEGLVHYEALGRGKPLLLLHGWLGSWRYWVPVMEELSVEYRTYAFDLWGFGDSDRRDGDYNVESYVKLLNDFVENLGISHTRLPIVGHALGAVVALLWAVRHPDNIDRVMVVSMPVGAASINRRLTTAGALSLFDRAFSDQPPDFGALQFETRKADEAAVIKSAHSVLELDLQHELQRIRVPVLVVHGARDDIVTPASGNNFTNSEFVRELYLSESRHFPMLDERPRFNRLLRDFLVAKDLGSLALKEEWRRQSR